MNVRSAGGALFQGALTAVLFAAFIGVGVVASNEDATTRDGFLIFTLISLFGVPIIGALFWIWWVVLGSAERVLRKPDDR
jgi:hypothetical protein